MLDGLIGTLLGTNDVKLSSGRARATASGVPYDPLRIECFRQLATDLLATGLPVVAEDARHDVSVFAFFESYFSNYIEGNPPEQLTSESTFEDLPHAGYRDWLRAAG